MRIDRSGNYRELKYASLEEFSRRQGKIDSLSLTRIKSNLRTDFGQVSKYNLEFRLKELNN